MLSFIFFLLTIVIISYLSSISNKKENYVNKPDKSLSWDFIDIV